MNNHSDPIREWQGNTEFNAQQRHADHLLQTNTNNPDDFEWLDEAIMHIVYETGQMRRGKTISASSFPEAKSAIIARFQAQEQRHQVEVVRARVQTIEQCITFLSFEGIKLSDEQEESVRQYQRQLEAQLNTLTTTGEKERTDE
jgi:hypothetical protein